MTRNALATLIAAIALLGLSGLTAGSAGADHGVAHNGETAEVSKTEGLTQDEIITVTGIGYEPGATLTVVQCYIFPATGPTDCELSNYGQHTGTVGDDGTATVEYKVNIVDGRCDHATPCFVVVSDGIGPDANGVGTEVTFAAADDADADEEMADEEASAEDEAAEEAEAEPEPEQEEEVAAEPETAAATATETSAADTDESADDDGGSNAGLIIAIVAIIAIVGGGAAYAMRGRNAG